MKKSLFLCLISAMFLQASSQSKVFKEVGEDMSSEILVIRQDDFLVGYVAFTQLEKADKDSFNYRLTIMDENLNDIGVVNFRQEKLILESASFEQDVLCLAYLKTNLIGKEFKTWRAFTRFDKAEGASSAFFQFLNLQGTIIKTHAIPVSIQVTPTAGKFVARGDLNTPIHTKNIPGQGFVCYYADENDKKLFAFDLSGTQVWTSNIRGNANLAAMLLSGQETYLLMKKPVKMDEGGYELLAYNNATGKAYPKHELMDDRRQYLKVLGFGIDPATGKPFISGNIIDERMGNKYERVSQIVRGTYAGVFTININSPEKKGFSPHFSYWKDGAQSGIGKAGYLKQERKYARLLHSFRDDQGNTYFAGSSFIVKPKIGSIAASVITIPTIVVPITIGAMGGYRKYKTTDAVILKQDAKGNLTVAENIDWTKGRFHSAYNTAIRDFDKKYFYTVSGNEVKNSHLILDDSKNIIIYDLIKHKQDRVIAIKEGKTRTYVIPAKEGHIMISEYDGKEKTTSISIESL